MKTIKLRLMVLAVLAIVFALLTQGSLAYYTTIGQANNVITSGNIKFIIHEKMRDGSDFPEDGMFVTPGQVVEKIVTIQSACEHPFYLRVKLVSSVSGSDLSVDDCLGIDIDTENWIPRNDGYYYYVDIVQPGDTTKTFFNQVEIIGEKIGNEFLGKTLSLTVSAEAVQSENNPAENTWDAQGWPVAE